MSSQTNSRLPIIHLLRHLLQETILTPSTMSEGELPSLSLPFVGFAIGLLPLAPILGLLKPLASLSTVSLGIGTIWNGKFPPKSGVIFGRKLRASFFGMEVMEVPKIHRGNNHLRPPFIRVSLKKMLLEPPCFGAHADPPVHYCLQLVLLGCD